MNDNFDLEKARDAYARAWELMKKYGDEALVALQKAQLVSSQSGYELYVRQAERAIQQSEAWRSASEMALQIIQEILAGYPGVTIGPCKECDCGAFIPDETDSDVCISLRPVIGLPCGHRKRDHTYNY
jgi:hypothetical protein